MQFENADVEPAGLWTLCSILLILFEVCFIKILKLQQRGLAPCTSAPVILADLTGPSMLPRGSQISISIRSANEGINRTIRTVPEMNTALPHDHVFSPWTRADPLDRYTDLVLHVLYIFLRLRRQILPLPDTGSLALPAFKGLVDHA
jgi:hypothetical protein